MTFVMEVFQDANSLWQESRGGSIRDKLGDRQRSKDSTKDRGGGVRLQGPGGKEKERRLSRGSLMAGLDEWKVVTHSPGQGVRGRRGTLRKRLSSVST